MKSNFDAMIYDQFNGVPYLSDKICVAIRTPPGKLVEFHCSSMNDGKDDGINLFSSIGKKIEKRKRLTKTGKIHVALICDSGLPLLSREKKIYFFCYRWTWQ